MSDLNVYICTGRLGADAETRYTANGSAIWQCRLAVGYGYGDNAGTNWLRVSAFGKRAEGLAKLELTKGAHVAVTGELRVREYDRKDGGKGTSVEINATDIALLGGRPEGKREAAPTRAKPQPESAGGGFEDDDLDGIPF